MPSPTPEYRRLPGRGLRRAGIITLVRAHCRLWLAHDHLLMVESNGYAEEYRRFYFQDVQSITVRKTARGRNWNIAWAVSATVFALIGLPFGPVGAAIFWSLSGLCLLCLAFNALRGPTCVCHLRTAVQQDELPSLSRLRVARKVLAQIQPALEQVQGTLTGDEVAARIRSAALGGMAQTESAPARTHPLVTARPAAAVSNYSGWMHAITFWLLLGWGVVGVLDFFIRYVGLVIAASVLALAVCATAIIAVVRQHGSALSPGLQRLSWGAVAFVVLNGVIGYIMFFVFAFTHGAQVGPGQEWQYMNVLAEISPLDSPLHLALSLFMIGGSWGLGSVGLFWLHQFRKRQTREQVAKAFSALSAP
jgi:hypothetical protein